MPSNRPPPRNKPAARRKKAKASGGLKLPRVEPGKKPTRVAPARGGGRLNAWVKSAVTGCMAMCANARCSVATACARCSPLMSMGM